MVQLNADIFSNLLLPALGRARIVKQITTAQDCREFVSLISQVYPGGKWVSFPDGGLFHFAYQVGGRIYDLTAAQYVARGVISNETLAKLGLRQALERGVFTPAEYERFIKAVQDGLMHVLSEP